MELAARAFKVQLQYLDVLDPKDIETAFRAASKGRAEAVLVLRGPVLTSQRTQVVDLAVKNRLPAIYRTLDFVEAGGLMTYGASSRLGPARRHLCGQDFERQKARGPSGRAADQV